jgi:uncharacterized membrane protein
MASIVRSLRGGESSETTRLEAFSDAVIAIAMTLLVIEIHVPDLIETEDGLHLWSELWHLWPSYLGYAISFIVIGIMWANHHNVFKVINRVDQPLIIVNTVFLLFVCFIPFTTALLAEYLGHEGEKTATLVYTGWFLVTAISYNLLWRYASTNNRLLDPEADPAFVTNITRRFNLGPPTYAASFLLAFIYPPASIAIFALLAILYALPNRGPI